MLWQTVLAGSYDDFVYAYSVDYGRALGKVQLMNFFFLHDSSLAMKLLSVASEMSTRVVTEMIDFLSMEIRAFCAELLFCELHASSGLSCMV